MKAFTVADALDHADAAKAAYARLIEKESYDVGIYRPEGVDPQKPHTRDEVYVIAAGSGDFFCAGETRAFKAGDMLFVPAGVEHRFEYFSKDFSAWVIFFGARV